jgi:hypothetical protein
MSEKIKMHFSAGVFGVWFRYRLLQTSNMYNADIAVYLYHMVRLRTTPSPAQYALFFPSFDCSRFSYAG